MLKLSFGRLGSCCKPICVVLLYSDSTSTNAGVSTTPTKQFMRIIDDLYEAQLKVRRNYGSVDGRGEEVWSALSPDAQHFILSEFRPRVWSCDPELDEMGLMNVLTRSPHLTGQIMKASGYGYLIAPPGNKQDRTAKNVVPFVQTPDSEPDTRTASRRIAR